MDSINFTFSTYVPTQGRYYRYNSFDGKTHLAIAKYIQNGENERVLQLFERLLCECCEDDINITKLHNVDLFCLLLNLRIMSVSDKFEFKAQVDTGLEKTKNTVRLDLYDILDKVTNNPNKFENRVRIDDDVFVYFGYPAKLMYDQQDDMIVETIKKIETTDKIFDISDMSVDQKTQILDNMSGDVLMDAIKYIKQLDQNYRVPVFDSLGVVSEELRAVELKLFDNSFFEFLKLMYNCNLEEQYYNRYIMVKHMGFMLSDVENNPPIEIKTYIKMYEQELDEQRKAHEKSSKSGGQTVGADPRIM